MVVGHIAVALAAKRLRPDPSLGWYVAAANALDLLWPPLLLAGVERVRVVPGATAFNPLVFEHYPWTHSLVMAVVWGLALAALARARGVDRRAIWLIAALVVSHWVLDLVTHAPDLPLWPGPSPRFALGLWRSIPATLVVEGLLWVAGIAIYLRDRRPRGRVGVFAFWSLIVVTTLIWATGPFSAPPDVRALPWFAMFAWVIVPWAAWADRWYVRRPPSP